MEQGREMLNRFLTDLFDRFQHAEAAFFSGADLSPQEAKLLETVCYAVDGGLDNRSTAIATEKTFPAPYSMITVGFIQYYFKRFHIKSPPSWRPPLRPPSSPRPAAGSGRTP